MSTSTWLWMIKISVGVKIGFSLVYKHTSTLTLHGIIKITSQGENRLFSFLQAHKHILQLGLG